MPMWKHMFSHIISLWKYRVYDIFYISLGWLYVDRCRNSTWWLLQEATTCAGYFSHKNDTFILVIAFRVNWHLSTQYSYKDSAAISLLNRCAVPLQRPILPSKSNPRLFLSYLLLILFLYFLLIFYLPRYILLDFPTISSRASLPFFACYRQTANAHLKSMTIPVLSSLDPSVIFLLNLLPSVLHPTWFSFYFFSLPLHL